MLFPLLPQNPDLQRKLEKKRAKKKKANEKTRREKKEKKQERKKDRSKLSSAHRTHRKAPPFSETLELKRP